MFVEYLNQKGVDAQQRFMESLEDFARFDEFDDLRKQFYQILLKAK